MINFLFVSPDIFHVWYSCRAPVFATALGFVADILTALRKVLAFWPSADSGTLSLVSSSSQPCRPPSFVAGGDLGNLLTHADRLLGSCCRPRTRKFGWLRFAVEFLPVYVDSVRRGTPVILLLPERRR